ncbi:lipoprotein N-acyltransferase Lnb domain-containing protein [Candidatus Vampirococcus lugosii]|uniref:Membrane protein n=1 Tax=Candidatus Vampirococcus lugosii TaxID=2789015 RepID=A0ABS5QKR3_9BACT|nr:DUF4105 domain-containing protein [Candidatus Vampirococcus lugosii]MBS8121816.1 membrane protein [Candidatus Vampirococcus lugosii]
MFFPDIKRNDIWQNGHNKLCSIEKNGNKFIIENIRDFDHENNEFNYINKIYDLENLEKIILHSCPFGFKKLFSHLIIEFCFSGEKSLFLSVESRRQEGEGFSIIKGCFRHYGLIFVWGTKKDLIHLRTKIRKTKIETYELMFDDKKMKEGFLYLIEKTNSLIQNPKYYNSFFCNCVTNLYDVLKIYSKKNIKFSSNIIFSSKVPNYLKKYGYIK